MRKNRKTLVKILTILTLLIGTFTIFQAGVKIVTTSWKLLVINDNIQFYNEQERKTDQMTEEYLKNIEARQELYESQDFTVRTFSNLPLIVKVTVLLCAIALFFLIPYMWMALIAQEIVKRQRKLRRQRLEGKAMS